MNHSASSTAAANAVPPQPKPIRFVTNHDGPYAKRRRINSACLTCRRKKTRCSGERPVCGTCTQNKHVCGGYGGDNEPHTQLPPSPVMGNSKDGVKKPLRRGSDSKSAAIHKPKTEPTLQPVGPAPPHTMSANSNHLHQSDLMANTRIMEGEEGGHQALSLATRNRMPYFRYFGPTAIMPGFKQMVVKVKGKQHGTGHTSSDAVESSPGQPPSIGQIPSPVNEAHTPAEIPIYDTSAMSPSPLITHLCKVFFSHLGCNFPFLQKEGFMRDLEEKQVDAILVDAVCALAARFSTHPMLTGSQDGHKKAESEKSSIQPWEYGQAFAQRAKSAIPDSFPCPSVAVVQAALLLAYDEFGASRDSGLWMYLGICIRMAQDLGMHTLEGLKYEGRDGPNPKSVRMTPNKNGEPVQPSPTSVPGRRPSTGHAAEEQRAFERERLDTFWSIFFLDRAISSGTGRPVTLRDKDIAISFPSLDEVDPVSGWPLPFPALIRIVHLYGRVTDLLNSIEEKECITEDLQKQLDMMEYHLTAIYQGLSPKLHFNALNFQHYAKIHQGTNFALLHCWFHTLIVLLHQPTLLQKFEGNIEPLSTHSRELSMSSAKTVADILAFTELIDSKTGLGNPFTSQPIYIAACAFLKESTLHVASSNPHTRPSTPGLAYQRDSTHIEKPSTYHDKLEKHLRSNNERPTHLSPAEQNQAAKHTLLASAANQNYQRCYRALRTLEPYWAGVKYILTVLDQKAKGVVDPLLYTQEEIESSLEQPRPEPAFTSPGWRRKLSWGTYLTAQPISEVVGPASTLRNKAGVRTPTIPGSPMVNPSQAIGWSLTGTMNSPSTSLAVLYPNSDTRDTNSPPPTEKSPPSIMSLLSNPPTNGPTANHSARMKYGNTHSLRSPSSIYSQTPSQPYNVTSSAMTTMPPPTNFNPTHDPALVSDADLLLNIHSPFAGNSPNAARLSNPSSTFGTRRLEGSIHPSPQTGPNQDFSPGEAPFSTYPTPCDGPTSQVPFGDMMIESQDIDMSALGDDMVPWLESYLPHDMFGYFDSSGGFGDPV
ncbi:hypothetical protein GQ43DRAFT_297123 [Delitschia confertaspora ATCC 74209]|uniref:Zn(2)-C6 fungal-type domain-containing protein n=1 Tax=Delitschia confertaspora ATCC 74209 TaxID=1513339 RepID=A0A9P4JPJ3_9PLEO|nr:hypothetical protein GQ43DRAFT_297123 [Delitschia confertaspora ATCC 74209]